MPFPTKIAAVALAACVTGAIGVTGWWLVSGEDTAVPSGTAVATTPASDMPASDQPPSTSVAVQGGKPLLSFPRPGQAPLDVFGPCYDDTRGDDVVSASDPKGQTDCFVLRRGGRDFLDLARKPADSGAYIRVAGKERSSQTLILGDADNVLEIDGDFDVRISGPKGRENVLVLPELSRTSISFLQENTDVIVRTVSGSLRLVGQAEDGGQNGVIARIVLAGGEVVERSQIRVQAVFAQGTDGNDTINDPDADDSIYPKLGDDVIFLGGGNNRILYEGGNKTISSAGDMASSNSIDFNLAREDVVIMPSEDGRDVVIETPVGRLTLLLQMFHPIEHPRLPIHELRFKGTSLDAAGIRFAAEQFQESRSSVDQDDRARLRN